MKRLITFTLSLILVLLATVPVFAAPVDDEGNVALPTNESGIPTVNISDESIQAIADAVDGPGVSLTLNNGVSLTINEATYEAWIDYKYHIVFPNLDIAMFDEYSFTLNPYSPTTDSYVKYTGIEYFTKSDYRYPVSNSIVYLKNFMWADFNLQTEDGTLVYSSNAPAPPPVFTISFDTGFDDLIFDDQTSEEFHLPTPEYPGYNFVAWYLDEDFTQEYFPEHEFDKNTTLYAKWDKIPIIYYDCGYEDIVVEPQLLTELSPPQLDRPGIIFAGWFQDPEFMYIFDPMQMDITEDITVYAKWIEAPDMFIFHDTIFDSLQALLNCEPVTYILVLMCIILLLGIGKVLISTRF